MVRCCLIQTYSTDTYFVIASLLYMAKTNFSLENVMNQDIIKYSTSKINLSTCIHEHPSQSRAFNISNVCNHRHATRFYYSPIYQQHFKLQVSRVSDSIFLAFYYRQRTTLVCHLIFKGFWGRAVPYEKGAIKVLCNEHGASFTPTERSVVKSVLCPI